MIPGAQQLPVATVQIYHRFDLNEPSAYVLTSDLQVDLKRAVAHIQFMARHWFGMNSLVTNLGIAKALVQFYGCKMTSPAEGEELDVYDTVESFRATAQEVMADAALYRDGLRECIEKHLDQSL